MAKNFEDVYSVLDLNACIMHSYHGAIDDEPILGRDGQDIKNAHCGFNAFLDLYVLPILEDFQPRQILAAVDRGTDYQKEVFEDYKSEREKKKADRDPLEVAELQKMKDWCKRFLIQLGATVIGVKGVEADDVIGYLCEKLPGLKRIHSVDTDYIQLLSAESDDIELFLKNELVDNYAGAYKCSDSNEPVPFEVWRLFRSIVGKPADGYKGIKGAAKSAWTGLSEGVGIEGLVRIQEELLSGRFQIIHMLPGIPDKLREKMIDQQHQWEMCFELAGLHSSLCWKPRKRRIPKLDLIKRVGDVATLSKLMRIAQSSDRISEFTDYLPQEWLIDANNFEESDIEEFAEAVAESPHVSFDYESWSPYQDREEFSKAAKGRLYVDVLSQNISGVSFNFGANLQYTFYITVDHADSANLPKEIIAKFLAVIPKRTILVAQNAPFEITLTKTNLGITLEELHDTKIMQVYVDEDAETGLKKQSKAHLDYRQIEYMEVTEGKPMNEIPATRVLQYGCDDSTVTGRLYDSHKLVMLLEDTWQIYIDSEPFVDNVTSHSYMAGNRIDWKLLDQFHGQDEDNYNETHGAIHQLMSGHCKEPDKSAAIAYFKADEEYLRKSTRDKFKSGKATKDCIPGNLTLEEMSFADYWRYFRERRIDYLTAATTYRHFKTKLDKSDFVPTKTSLFTLIEKLGFKTIPQTYSTKNIRLWVEANLILDWETGEDEVIHKEFLESLIGAHKNIVKAAERSGKAYSKLIEVCNKFPGAVKVKTTSEGDELSVGSPKQIQELLYLKMGLPVRMHSKVTPGSSRQEYGVMGSPSSNELAINWALAEDMDGPDDWRIEVLTKFKEAKGYKTNISLFDVPYPLWKHPDTDRIHPSVINCGAKATKRMSGSAPNVMQVSNKSDMREVYLPNEDDHVLVGIDWSGQELRITAAECKDPTMLSAYVGKADELRDIHSLTGAGIAGIKYSEFYKAYQDENHPDHHYVNKVRKGAKAVNFGIIYGMSALALAQRLIIPQAESDKMMNNTNTTYPGLEVWQNATVVEAKRDGFVTTLFGAKKHAHPALFSTEHGPRSRVERQLINYKVQGCAANMLKRLFTMMWRTGIIQDLGVGFVLPIHDEVLASVPRKNLFEYIRRTSTLMTMPVPGCIVPMEVDVAISSISWGHMKEIGGKPTQADIDAALEKEVS